MQRRLLLVSVLVVGLTPVGSAPPAAAAVCSHRQLTFQDADSSTGDPSISDDGTVVAFRSQGDLAFPGANADGNDELYLIDLATGANPEQITVSTGPGRPDPELSGDGQRVAFHSEGEYGDAGDNGDGSGEIWLFDRAVGPAGIEQLTNSSGPDSTDPSISDDGTRIAFRSEADLTGENADGNGEIFLHDTDTDTTTQLTATTGGENLQPVITDDGTKVAFVSTVDLTDDAPDGGADLFVLDTDDHSVTRLADADAVGLESAAFDGSGTRFVSYGTVDLTGDNPDLSYEVFLHHLGTGTTTQLTDLPDDSVNLNRPDLAEAGNRVAFETDADLIGENADARHELFVVDRTGQVGPDQLSESPAGNGVSDPSVNADGSRIALAWTGDPSGGNADGGREIFVFTCGAPGPSFVDVSPGSFFYEQIEWMSGAGIASGFPGGRYKPTEAVRRQQMANFLHNLAGQPGFSPPPSPTFVDVPTSNPFFLQIEWMANEGIASGFPGGRFKPLGPVKRQQMANFLHNLAGQPAFTPPATPTFVDVPTTNPFYLQVEWMAAESIASGFSGGRFEPLDPVKRQQMANFLINLLNGPGIDLN